MSSPLISPEQLRRLHNTVEAFAHVRSVDPYTHRDAIEAISILLDYVVQAVCVLNREKVDVEYPEPSSTWQGSPGVEYPE